MALGQREGQGYTGARHHGAHQLELAVGVWPEIRDQLHDAMPGIGDAEGDGLELVRAGAQRRGRVPAGRAVVERARGREADRSGAHGLGGQRAHGGSVLGGGILQPGRPLAHHVEAQRAVGKLCAQVDVVRAPLDRVEILAEALPGPVDPLVEHRSGNVLDPFHQRDEPWVGIGAYRREADAAVAHDRGGHAVPARRRHPFVPRRLSVVMRMDVDEARGDQQPDGVDLLFAPAGDRAHGGDQSAVHRHVSPAGLAAAAVGHQPAAHHQVVCRPCHALPLTLPGQPGR